ncbi:MAG: nuclear transport factor 2 family protein [Steroidobacteraceae bacterium]
MTAAASSTTEAETIRAYYSGWEMKAWEAIDGLLADGFTFTSPSDDDHIGKLAFEAKCWPQAAYIEHFELQSVVVRGDEAFVRYCCRTRNGQSFQNVEYVRFKDGKIEAIEVYFGGHLGFPSAASEGHR